MFDFGDLKDEYKLMIPCLIDRYYQLKPNGTQRECMTYVRGQILRKARKLYDFSGLQHMLVSDYSLTDFLLCHKSTRERMADFKYYTDLNCFLSKAQIVLDIGCGLNPLLVMKAFPNITSYYCVDKDKKILDILDIASSVYLGRKPIIVNSSFQDCPVELQDISFDFVFLQKLIPTLTEKHNRIVMNNITKIKSKYILVTGSKFSLSREKNIQDTEDKAIQRFINRYHFVKIHFFDKSHEFGWVIKNG